MNKLIPLRIPSNWAVISNSFYEGEMIVENDNIVNYLSYQEDVLFIEECSYSSEGQTMIDKTGYKIDLGWYPDSNPNGFYKLTILIEGWNNVVAEFNSKDKSQVIEKLEQALLIINENRSDIETVRSEVFK